MLADHQRGKPARPRHADLLDQVRELRREVGALAPLRRHVETELHGFPPAGSLEHIPFGWNQPNGMCPLKTASSARTFPSRWNRARFHLLGNRSSLHSGERWRAKVGNRVDGK